MDTPTIATRRSWLSTDSRPTRRVSWNTTKANSPPSHKVPPSISAERVASPASRPTPNSTANFTSSSKATPETTSPGSAAIRSRSMPMPTAMKNRPSSSPLNGLICDSSSCRYSESASSTPAMNAPRPGLSPACCMIQALPSTASRAVAVNTSGAWVPATTRSARCISRRPPNQTRASAPSAWPTMVQVRVSLRIPPSSGITASNGIATRSWNSRIANASLPKSLPSCLRSASSCRPTAVDDSARPRPATSAPFQCRPKASRAAPSNRAERNTCAPPAPNTGRRISTSRAGDSSRPITNSSMTTPISEAARIRSGSLTMPIPSGPSSTPVAR